MGQYDMNDVFGEIVIVGGNKDFGVGDFVGIVCLGFCFGFYLIQIGVVLWFGQVYGVCLGVFGEWCQIGGFLIFVIVQLNGVYGIQGQFRVYGE